MTDRLKGKLAFCTASGAGIGRATAVAFAREGARVVASDLNEAAMAGLKEAGIAECGKLDARDTGAIVAMDFIGKGIRCNCICPGTIGTPSLDDRVKALGRQVGGEDKARRMFIERQPMGRLGTAEEMAHVAVYLASDESLYTTGSAILSDGGFTL